MKQLVLLLTLICNTLLIQSQSIKPIDLVNNSEANFISVDIVNPVGRTTEQIPSDLSSYQLLSLDANALRQVLNTRQEGISITLPKNDKENITLQLVEVELPLFKVRTASNEKVEKYQGGKHYRGIIRGDQGSIASMSIFEDGVMALISESGNKGNWVLGELEESDTYIFYNDPQLQDKFSLECGTEDSFKPYDSSILNDSHHGHRALTDCVGLYFEVDYDIYLDKGSNTTSVTNYVTGLYNQVATLYSNENINTNISEILIWDVTSPYNSTTSIGMLNQFTAYRQGFNGDLAMLLSYQASGGVAYVNGLCSSNPDYSMSFSSINSTYQNVPTYSWSVMVVAHEFGHLFGSQHTHACVWNGNNTAIDGCYATEGGCPDPGIPGNGGTIMSYCHLTGAGINLNLGFGPQPGNVIRASVTNANCLQSCGGGGNPPAGCNDNEATLRIQLDNYPGETTWEIKDNSGTVIYSGGPYSTPGSLVTIDICQPDGCYDFTINDSYGDGICCSYGQGFYEIEFNGNILANGGQFASTETKNFCLSGGGAPTCNDGIQNGDETGVDCGGSSCPACPTCNDGIQNGDETGVDCGGSSCPACPTCNDGIQNGDETGVDCGGSSCPPCSGGCNGTEVTVEIVLDNYPGETTWNLKDSNGVVVISGGPYNGQSGQTISVTECLSDGCYDFTILDSYGDGICCSYGQGSYNVYSGNTTYATGGQFGSSESTSFCLGSSPPTCNDGIQNGDETGVDCGGSSCPACPTCNDGIQNGDETGVDCGGSSCPTCPTCNDGIQNGDETGVDCGGSSCPACPTCNDGIQNGDETGVDCGGSSCPACPTCNDGIQNGDETGVDCGGSSCPACPTCNDGIQNGDETGVDCGGSSCPACPTCNDGIQNGDETGIDCGGSSCPPCSGGCNGTEVTVEIVLDNYPGETTWNLKDSNGVVVISGGPYNGQSGQTISVTECLSDGCYDFTILDSYGDGICCSYGQGSYNVYSGNTTYATGGQFGSSESTNFCLGSTPPTCNDGIQNGDETGVDCGGSSCPACPTCNDGIQNGDETGVDCGGSSCPACPTCNDGIQNGDETGVDCGGSSCPACPTCNDGIQNGDETGVDCGGSSCPACPTCNDGIQNGDETGVDCGGSSCPPCGGGSSTTLAAHYFETGWDNWIDGGSDCYRNNSATYAYEGNYSIRLRDNSGLASSMTSEVFNVSSFNILTFDFYFYPYSMETGENFTIEFYDGASWLTIANYVSGTDFSNYSFYNATITLNSSNVNFPVDAQFRITCDASTNSDRVYIDAVTIEGSTGSPLLENNRKITKLRSSQDVYPKDVLTLTPNPARDYIAIEVYDEEETIGTVMAIDVFDMMGRRVISRRNVDDLEYLRLDVSQLNTGSYILRLNTDGEEVLTKRFQVVQQ